MSSIVAMDQVEEVVRDLQRGYRKTRELTGQELVPMCMFVYGHAEMAFMPLGSFPSLPAAMPYVRANASRLDAHFAVIMREAWFADLSGQPESIALQLFAAYNAGTIGLRELPGSREIILVALEHPLGTRMWSADIVDGRVGDFVEMPANASVAGMAVNLSGLAPEGR